MRRGVGWDDGVVGSATVSAVEDDSQAAYTLATETPVVVEDLAAETRFSGPELLRSHDVRGGISTIIGPVSDPWGVLGTHDTERRTFSEHDANFVQSVATIIATAVDRRADERELIVQRERLAALNSLGGVVRGITESVIDQSTREEIEAAVCNRLADSESYLFAWVGDADTTAGTVRLRTEAGVDGYLDDVSISVDPDDERGEGPTGRAFRTGEIQTTRDVDSDPRYEPWRDHAREHGFRSSAAIPITHDDTVYGVLNLYTERRNAFEREEREMVAQLGEVVGHAIAAVERKQALMSDELVELGFRIREAFGSIDSPVGTTGTIALDHTVPVGDGTFLAYGTAPAEAVDSLDAIVGAVPHWESVTIRSEGDRISFEARLTDPPVLSVVASLGGYIDRTEFENGTYRMVVHLAPNVDVNRVVDVVEETYPGAELFRRRQIDREHDDLQRRQRRPAADLTDRQRTALEAAYHAGFFEWPRDASGEDVADSIGIAPSTFHQHLRKAEREVFDTMFSHPVPDSG